MSSQPTKRRRSAPTISDVARTAGVSPMTVSRVINGEASVRAETRATVEAAIAALNYAPNPAARSLAGMSQIRIGLLYSSPSAAYLSEFLVGGLEQASRSHVQLVVEKCDVGGPEVEAARELAASGVDGAILPPPICENSAVRAILEEAGMPMVAVAAGSLSQDYSAVSIDNYGAAKAMTQHILALGHVDIGFIIGNLNHTDSTRRLDGFRDALKEAGLPLNERYVAQGEFTYRSGLDAAEQLLDLETPPSAIFASNDDMAAATVAVAHRRGLDVPGDLTVCGFDDTALATTIWPELTTIHQPIAEMSRVALDTLVQVIKARRAGRHSAAQHVLLDFELIRRQSDAAPRRRPPVRSNNRR